MSQQRSLCLLALLAASACNMAQQASVHAPIVGGREVSADEEYAARTVLLVIRQPTGGSSICTGSIVASDLILTAAHCLMDEEGNGLAIKVVFNTQNMRTGPVRDVRDAVGFTINGDFILNSMIGAEERGDLGLVRFEGGLPAAAKINRVLENDQEFQVGQQAILAGFGRDTIDPAAVVSGSGVLRVAATVPVLRISTNKSEVVFDQSTLPGGYGACQGDSGGPAWTRGADGELRLFGVTSRGESAGPGACAVTGIYTDLRKHAEWLRQASSDLRTPQTQTAPAELAALTDTAAL
jgi:secreted trypsin-like serine protease